MALATGDDCRMPSHPSYILSRHVGDLGRGECVKQILLQLFGEPQPTAGGIDRPLFGRHGPSSAAKKNFRSGMVATKSTCPSLTKKTFEHFRSPVWGHSTATGYCRKITPKKLKLGKVRPT